MEAHGSSHGISWELRWDSSTTHRLRTWEPIARTLGSFKTFTEFHHSFSASSRDITGVLAATSSRRDMPRVPAIFHLGYFEFPQVPARFHRTFFSATATHLHSRHVAAINVERHVAVTRGN